VTSLAEPSAGASGIPAAELQTFLVGIDWPKVGEITISERDATYPPFDRRVFEEELAGSAGPGT